MLLGIIWNGGENKLIELDEVELRNAVKYNILAENGKKFCECIRTYNEIYLVTKQGKIGLLGFMEQVMNVDKSFKRHQTVNVSRNKS